MSSGSIINKTQENEAIFKRLIEACYSGNLNQVETLYQKLLTTLIGIIPPDLDMQTKMREAAIAAASAGHAHILDFLLSSRGASVEVCGALSTSAASGSKAKKSTDIFNVLLKYGWGPDMEMPAYGNALTRSIIDRNVAAIQFLLSHGASPSRPLQQHRAFGWRRWAMAQGLTPLDYAAAHGTPEIVFLLLAHGADLSKCDALHHATTAQWGEEQTYHEIIKILLENGMDINIVEGAGDNERLQEWGIIKDNEQDYPLGTALHYAARNGYPKRVKFLLEMGADRNVKATNGLTALEWIEGHADFWDEEIGEMLKRK